MSRKIFLSSALGILSLCWSLGTPAAQVTVEAEGSGGNIESAIEQALIHASRQVNGLSLSSDTKSFRQITGTAEDDEITRTVNASSAVKSRGVINSYQVLSKSCDGVCSVRLSVDIEKYQPKGVASERRSRLAVGFFSGKGQGFRDDLQAQLQSYLVQTRRFSVLDRSSDDAYQAEMNLLMSNDVPVQERARMGQVLGLDYIVNGEVDRLSVVNREEKVPLTGESYRVQQSIAKVSYQVIKIPTREVKWTDSVTLSLDSADTSRLAARIAEKISEQLIANIYPMRVIGTAGNQLTLNQGGKTVKAQETYTVYALGESLKDPYTGESLGRIETPVATIRIVEVLPKVSYAEIMDGNIENIDTFSIARKGIRRLPSNSVKKQSKPQAALKKANASRTAKPVAGGGVIL